MRMHTLQIDRILPDFNQPRDDSIDIVNNFNTDNERRGSFVKAVAILAATSTVATIMDMSSVAWSNQSDHTPSSSAVNTTKDLEQRVALAETERQEAISQTCRMARASLWREADTLLSTIPTIDIREFTIESKPLTSTLTYTHPLPRKQKGVKDTTTVKAERTIVPNSKEDTITVSQTTIRRTPLDAVPDPETAKSVRSITFKGNVPSDMNSEVYATPNLIAPWYKPVISPRRAFEAIKTGLNPTQIEHSVVSVEIITNGRPAKVLDVSSCESDTRARKELSELTSTAVFLNRPS